MNFYSRTSPADHLSKTMRGLWLKNWAWERLQWSSCHNSQMASQRSIACYSTRGFSRRLRARQALYKATRGGLSCACKYEPKSQPTMTAKGWYIWHRRELQADLLANLWRLTLSKRGSQVYLVLQQNCIEWIPYVFLSIIVCHQQNH